MSDADYKLRMEVLIRRFKDGEIDVKELEREGRKLFEARYFPTVN